MTMKEVTQFHLVDDTVPAWFFKCPCLPQSPSLRLLISKIKLAQMIKIKSDSGFTDITMSRCNSLLVLIFLWDLIIITKITLLP